MIIVMGAVGSGKSEQTNRLAKRYRLTRISTSQLLRQHPTPDREAKMKAGDLVNDDEIIELLEPEIKKMAGAEFLLDGFPRSVPQAEWLVRQSKAGAINLTAIIKLDISQETVLKRLLARGREDDKEQIILHRLRNFEATTKPVINYLRRQGIAVDEVDGEKSPDEVEAAINKILENKSGAK